MNASNVPVNPQNLPGLQRWTQREKKHTHKKKNNNKKTNGMA